MYLIYLEIRTELSYWLLLIVEIGYRDKVTIQLNIALRYFEHTRLKDGEGNTCCS